MTSDLTARVEGKAGILSLNRPGALHALTLDMVHAMTSALLGWRDDTAVEIVLIDHAEGRGFCAGGDIAALRESLLADGVAARRFFHDEYQLDHLLYSYPKPLVSFLDGIVMGGGVGIAMPAKYRVATENTRFAMPETGIGLFPDVGGSRYLSQLEGRVGQFLALTGARMDGAECLMLGLATHYLPADALAEAKMRIAAQPERAEGILGTLSAKPPQARVLGNILNVNRLFAGDTLELVLAALDADGSDWAEKEAATIRSKSPQSCKVALRQLIDEPRLDSFADVMRMEYRIAVHILAAPDFVEGVRALIVDKDNSPRWNPTTPEAVSDAMVDAIFAPLPADQEWNPL